MGNALSYISVICLMISPLFCCIALCLTCCCKKCYRKVTPTITHTVHHQTVIDEDVTNPVKTEDPVEIA